MSTQRSQTPRVLILGGLSYAGLAAATNLLDLSRGLISRFQGSSPCDEISGPLKDGIKITLVDERDGFYHVIGSPLALADSEYASKAWVPFEEIKAIQHPSIKFIHGSVANVDTVTKTARIIPHGKNATDHIYEEYDYLLTATGLRRVFPVVPQSLTRNAYLPEAQQHTDQVRSSTSNGVVVIGGGAVGIEMAAEIKDLYPHLAVTLVHSRDRLLSSEPLPDDFKDKTLEVLRETGVKVLTGARVLNISEKDSSNGDVITLTLSNNTTMPTSHVINAISKAVPTTSYLPTTLLNSEGYIPVRPSLHFLNTTSTTPDTNTNQPVLDPYHLAAGDITTWPGIKRCGAAMHMGIFAGFNIHKHIVHVQRSSSNTSMRPSSPYASQASDSFDDIPDTIEPQVQYNELQAHDPMIGLAIGKTATIYSPLEGTKAGPEVLGYMFGDDLGFSICWRFMRLGESPVQCSADDGGHDDDTRVVVENVGGDVDGVVAVAPEAPVALEEGGQPKMAGSSGEKSGRTTPTLSATGSSASEEGESEMEVEPQTLYDAVGNAEVTNFEALEKTILNGNDVDEVAGKVARVSMSERRVSPVSLEKIVEEREGIVI